MSGMLRQRKADRWDRMAERAVDNHNGAFPESMIAKLLRREHRAVVRMVHNCVPNKAWSAVASLGYGQAVEDILNLLEARAR